MAIKISGTTVIDDDRNLISTGIATIGTGSSTTTVDGVSGVVNVGTGVTINAVTGDINTIGIVTVGQLNVPVEISSFSPVNGSTNSFPGVVNIVITFNQTVGFGTTGFIELKLNGTSLDTFYPSSSGIALTVGGTTLNITPTTSFNFEDQISLVMSPGFVTSNGNDFAGINTVGSGVTYSFDIKSLELGDPYEGGYLICQSGSTQWIVSPSSTEVVRNWSSRANAVTTAQANAACGDWFVPTCGQLENPGYQCRTYWDSYDQSSYWSNNPLVTYSRGCSYVVSGPYRFTFPGRSCSFGKAVNMSNGSAGNACSSSGLRVRAFRCVSY